MRYPAAEWMPGPPSKVNRGVNTCRGVVCHSMVGPYSAALAELYRFSRRASWHYSVLKDGRVIAHYPDEAQAWHAGSAYNNSTIGVEHEGGLSPVSEPLTPAQLAASVRLVQWLAKAHGFPLVRTVGLWEHNEVSGEPTACPSGRIPWDQYIEEDDDMAIELVWVPMPLGGGRLYVLGQGDPRWIADGVGAADLQRAYGAPQRALSWAAIKALGAK